MLKRCLGLFFMPFSAARKIHFLSVIDDGLNNCLTLEANVDQTARSFVQDVVKSIAASPNGALIMEFFENFIKTAYGEKSDDGRRFMKSEEISRGFMETPAYEVLFEKLVTDAGAASEFVNRVMRANGNKQAAPIASN